MKNMNTHYFRIASLVGAATTLLAVAPSVAQAETESHMGRNSVTFGGALMFGHLGCKTSDGGDCTGGGVAAFMIVLWIVMIVFAVCLICYLKNKEK